MTRAIVRVIESDSKFEMSAPGSLFSIEPTDNRRCNNIVWQIWIYWDRFLRSVYCYLRNVFISSHVRSLI